MTTEQHELRRGKFTGSEIIKILGIKGLGDTGDSYAFEKAVEIVFGIDEDAEEILSNNWDVKRGNELEPLAFRKFSELKSADFITVDKCQFFAHADNAGASPDGIVGTDAVLEIKCPKPNKLLKLMALGSSEIDKGYVAQMQMEMMVT